MRRLLFAPIAFAALLASPASAQDAKGTAAPKPADTVLTRIEIDGMTVHEGLRLISEVSGINAVASEAAGARTVTLRLRGTTARVAIEALGRAAGLGVREEPESGLFRLTTSEEYQQDVIVSRERQTRVFTLLHPNAVGVATAIRDLYGDRVRLSYGFDDDDLSGSSSFGGGAFGAGGNNSATRRGTSVFDGSGNGFQTDSGVLNSGSGGTGDDTRQDRNLLRDQKLTTEQIAAIERARASAAGDRAMQAEIGRIAEAERPIYVTVQRRNNLLIVRTGDTDALSEIERLVTDMDRATPQVLLELRILEAQLDDEFRSVFDIDYTGGPFTAGPRTSQPRNPLLGTASLAPQSVGGLGNFPLEGGTLVYQYMSDNLRARIQLLETRNRISTIGSPVILCANDAEAQLFVGEERPLVRNFTLQTSVADGVVSDRVVPEVQVQDIGNTIRIRPRINADRTVTLLISFDASTTNIGGATIPVPLSNGGVSEFAVDTVNSTNVEATIVGNDGMTLAIGGLIRKEKSDSVTQVPVLGDIPLLGLLFKREVKTTSRREMLLIVTPHVLTTPEEGKKKSQERLRALSDHPGLEPDALRPAQDPEDSTK